MPFRDFVLVVIKEVGFGIAELFPHAAAQGIVGIGGEYGRVDAAGADGFYEPVGGVIDKGMVVEQGIVEVDRGEVAVGIIGALIVRRFGVLVALRIAGRNGGIAMEVRLLVARGHVVLVLVKLGLWRQSN